MDKKTEALGLAKQILYDCEGDGDITVPKETLRIILNAFVDEWIFAQGKIRQSFEKVK
jgi:hypothetical protein